MNATTPAITTPSTPMDAHQSTHDFTHHFTQHVRSHINALADALWAALQGNEAATLTLNAEQTLFIRFNSNRVRQNTDVEQITLTLQLQGNGRTSTCAQSLSGVWPRDLAAMQQALAQCRSELAVLPADPHQVAITNHGHSDAAFTGQLLTPAQVVSAITAPLQGCDMAGLYAGGVVLRASLNSAGQRHWFSSETFFVDYSLYNGARAVKGGYAHSVWDDAAWAANVAHSKQMLSLMDKPLQTIAPGRYRTYLSPAALADLVTMLGWDALAASAWKQGRSPFKKLIDEEASLSPLLHITENFDLGLTPRFNNVGEVSASQLPLIAGGQLSNLLVSSRTAQEYGLTSNAAEDNEAPRALDVSAGTLPESEILAALGTGMYLSNLHYLNWSDPSSARVTGMTRYACFWVENGAIVGPIQDMRWDESLFTALGDNLLALTQHPTITPEISTYFNRSLGGTRTPGALIEGFCFTL